MIKVLIAFAIFVVFAWFSVEVMSRYATAVERLAGSSRVLTEATNKEGSGEL